MDMFEDFFKEQGRLKEQAELNKANEKNPEVNTSLKERLTKPMQIGNKQPSAEFIKSQENDSKNPFFYTIRGMVYKQKGWFKLAEADFHKALELDPKQPAAYHLGMICFMKDDMDGAKKWCKISHESLPSSGFEKFGLKKTKIHFTSVEDVVYYLGAIIATMKDPDEALKHLKTATKMGNHKASELLQMLENEIQSHRRL